MKTVILVIAVFVLCVLGWFMNLVKFLQCDFEPSYKAEVIHGVGIVIPVVGIVAGYMDFGK